MAILSKSSTVNNTGPKAKAPDGSAGNRTKSDGSRPTSNPFKTPSSAPRDPYTMGRKPSGTRADDPS